MIIDLSKIPSGWFVLSMAHAHTQIRMKGDVHTPMAWQVELQHVSGGKVCTGTAYKPQEALQIAIDEIRERWPAYV